VTLDLTGVDAIDAAGIGSLVALQASGIFLKLLNPSEQVREVLKVTEVDSILDICESRAAEARAGILAGCGKTRCCT